ncbi:MAG: Gfo/Idh/MocA family oxidoreductase [Elusimicrobiota bacterium]
MDNKRKYLLAGAGARGLNTFAAPILKEFSYNSTLTGLYDISLKRLQGAKEILGVALPVYTDFALAMKELNPDCVIVCTPDYTHAQYVIKALKMNKDVISEKPLCISSQQCKEISDAAKKSKGRVFTAHNFRFGPAMTTIKKIISEGKIGKPLSVFFNEKLDRCHGADYFRRWHRLKENSGGLLIHKASHCFDLINWVIGSKPKEVFANGKVGFYGKNGPYRAKRCRECDKYKDKCDFYADLFKNEDSKKMYLNAEEKNGYFRDQCVYDKGITTEDLANVIYSYENGVLVNFMLCAFSSYEGIDIIIEGTKGRLEYSMVHDTRWFAGNVTVFGMEKHIGEKIQLYLINEGVKESPIPRAEGEHGGADPAMREALLGSNPDRQLTNMLATLEEAISAVLIGAAANKSIAGHKSVKINHETIRLA